MGGKGSWRLYLGLIAVGIALVVLLNVSGIPEQGRDKIAEQQSAPPQETVRKMPPAQRALFALGGLVWIGGVNALAVRQRRRAGMSWGACFNPLIPFYRNFDAGAWRIFGILTLAAMALGLAAFSMTAPG